MELNQAQCRALGINAGFIIFIIIVMGMRMWARLVITKAIGFDDRVDIPAEAWEPMLLSFWVSRLLYAIAMVLVKVALLLFYLRLDDRLLMRWAVHSLTVVVIGMGVGHFVMSVIECSPPEVFWTSKGDRIIYMQQCMTQSKQQAFWDAAGIIVIITDICLWICPIPMIWNLQLPKRQKWAVSAVFALGIISVVAGCVRFYYVRQLANEPELYQQLAYSLVWYALELYVAIFCGCSSALKVFFKRYFPALLGSSSSRAGYPLDSCGNTGTKTRTSHPLTDLSDRLPGNHTVISSGGRGGRVTANTGDSSNNDSEEAIILGGNGIQKQTEVQVRQEMTRISSDSEGRRTRSGSNDRPKARSFVV
ncbi:hypothetical protein GCG54_00004010 [Colletotrichum gloeosporioides]|uniref:Rhodopsin domain-containing protein n=1 Tax=Colletotrichum gloeosporioides TaxID=474922 RepID=A0A8H4C621_COLGL|nr:uncharacterized protein GCG54_00004010 [Colletotrichum gloeosporioides]KAF3798105.1 hypothetical protein GCG54_00004010 [Colletotrichum gloeosporioides]